MESTDSLLQYLVYGGKNGVEKVLELQLTEDEMALLQTSRKHVKEVMTVLDNMTAKA